MQQRHSGVFVFDGMERQGLRMSQLSKLQYFFLGRGCSPGYVPAGRGRNELRASSGRSRLIRRCHLLPHVVVAVALINP